MHEPTHIYNAARPLSGRHAPAANEPTSASAMRDMQQAAGKAAVAGDHQAATTLKRKAAMQGLLYLAHDSEVEAYGHQFAMIYHRHYRGQPYDRTKMAKLAIKLYQDQHRSINANAYNYFVLMRKPWLYNYADKHGRRPFQRAIDYIDEVMSASVGQLLNT
jgi:hypothetical protein